MKGVKNTLKLAKICIQIKPFYLVYGIISAIMSLIVLLMPIGIVQVIINLYQHQKPFYYILITCGIFSLFFYGINCTSFYLNKLYNHKYRDFRAKFEIMIFNKLNEIDYDVYQSSSFLNDYTRAIDEGPNAAVNSFWGVSRVVESVLCVITIFGIFSTLHWLIIVYALVVGTIFFFLGKHNAALSWSLSEKQKHHFRHRGYIRRMFYLKDASEDIRTSKIKDVFLDINDEVGNKVIKNTDKYLTKRSTISFIANFLVKSIYPVTIAFLAYFTIENVNIANFAALLVAAESLRNNVLELSDSLAYLESQGVQGQAIFLVLNQKGTLEVSGTKEPDTFEKLEVKNLHFSYKDKEVLSDINITINKGDKIAIVGENGAGKTTFVKLLLRLYDPQKGSIAYNDTNYQDLKPLKLRERIGAAFQEFEVYAFSIAENILLRNVKTEEDEALVIEALKFSGLYDKVMNLKNGIHTQVTKEFDEEGVEFSGGEKQKLALARTFASQYDVIILDEPNSALDPLAEAEIYNKMMQLGDEHTLIFISHRLSTTIKADKIYLFENGRIVEEGSHKELMQIENGKYQYMFKVQAENYVNGGIK